MIHARIDYAHIQDEMGKVKKDEPVFLLRAKDMLVPRTVRFWAELLLSKNGDKVAYEAALKQTDAMEVWQDKNNFQMPDTLLGVVRDFSR